MIICGLCVSVFSEIVSPFAVDRITRLSSPFDWPSRPVLQSVHLAQFAKAILKCLLRLVCLCLQFVSQLLYFPFPMQFLTISFPFNASIVCMSVLSLLAEHTPALLHYPIWHSQLWLITRRAGHSLSAAKKDRYNCCRSISAKCSLQQLPMSLTHSQMFFRLPYSYDYPFAHAGTTYYHSSHLVTSQSTVFVLAFNSI